MCLREVRSHVTCGGPPIPLPGHCPLLSPRLLPLKVVQNQTLFPLPSQGVAAPSVMQSRASGRLPSARPSNSNKLPTSTPGTYVHQHTRYVCTPAHQVRVYTSTPGTYVHQHTRYVCTPAHKVRVYTSTPGTCVHQHTSWTYCKEPAQKLHITRLTG